MTMAAYQKAVETNGAFHAAMTSIADVEDELRTAKESYFDHRFPPKGHPIICSFEREEDGMTVDQMIRIDDPFMKQVTAERPIHVLCDSKNTVSGSGKNSAWLFFGRPGSGSARHLTLLWTLPERNRRNNVRSTPLCSPEVPAGWNLLLNYAGSFS